MRKNIFNISNEDMADSTTRVEMELVYYAKIVDLIFLDKAISQEDQEQWEIKLPKSQDNMSSGRIRIRKTKTPHKTTFVQTIKIDIKDNAVNETSFIVNQDAFEQMKLLSGAGMVKRRYTFKTEVAGIFMEVDCFYANAEKTAIYPWVKIDIELPVGFDKNKAPKIPTQFSNVIYNQKGDQTQSEKDFIQALYDKAFLTKHV